MKQNSSDKIKWEKLQKYLKSQKLTISESRKYLYDYLFTIADEFTVIELHQRAREDGVKVALSTMYRAMKLLCEAKLFDSIRLDDGSARYVQASSQKYIRFVCQRCKRVIFAHDSATKIAVPKILKNCEILHTQISYRGLCPDCAE